MATPSTLMYSSALKQTAPKATVNRVQFQTDAGGSFSPNGQNIIRIPVQSASGFLDTRRSHVRATLNFTIGTAAGYLRSVYSCFDRLRIISSSGAVIEDIPNYGAIVNRYAELFMPADAYSGSSNLATSNGLGIYGGASYNSQDLRNWVSLPADASTPIQVAFPLPLSGWMSMTSSKHGEGGDGLYQPLPLINQYYIELTLRNQASDMIVGGATTTVSMTVSGVSYDACLIEYTNDVVPRLKAAVAAQGGKVFVSSETYQVTQLSANSGVINATVSSRARSVKGIANFLQTAEQRVINADYDASPYRGTTSWYLQANGARFPAAPLTTAADIRRNTEFFAGQILRGVGASNACFTSNTVLPTAAGAPVGSALFGVDLEQKSGSDFIEAGFDAASGAAQITINQTCSAPATIYYVNVLTHVDAVFVIDGVTKDLSVSI